MLYNTVIKIENSVPSSGGDLDAFHDDFEITLKRDASPLLAFLQVGEFRTLRLNSSKICLCEVIRADEEKITVLAMIPVTP